MSPEERTPLSEVTPAKVYSKAKEILYWHGHPGTSLTAIVIPRHGGLPPQIIAGADIPITEAPVTPIQIAGKEYRLWLRSKDDNNQSENHNGVIILTIHSYDLPNGLDRVEYDKEGHVTGHWYNPESGRKQLYVRMSRAPYGLPKELEGFWYCARTYLIKQDADNVEAASDESIPPEIVAPLLGGNDFLLGILKEMQTKLKQPSH